MGNHQGKTQKIGPYNLHIVKQIAEGGFSYVFLVKDTQSSKHYALKRILVRDDEELKAVKHEIDIMKKLTKHRNIVKFIDYSKSSNNEVFILMEYCAGGHLVDIMIKRQTNRFMESEILKIFLDICESVAYMHGQQPPIIHRDLKVENVLLDEESGIYKLCDFGSAIEGAVHLKNKFDIQQAEDDISRHTTIQYRAPEMVDLYRSNIIDEKADVWALGCLLYKLLFYVTPFEESGALGILNANYTIPTNTNYSSDIINLVRCMLNPDLNQRPNVFEVTNQTCTLKGVPPIFSNHKSKLSVNNPQPPKPLPKPVHLQQSQQQQQQPQQPQQQQPPSIKIDSLNSSINSDPGLNEKSSLSREASPRIPRSQSSSNPAASNPTTTTTTTTTTNNTPAPLQAQSPQPIKRRVIKSPVTTSSMQPISLPQCLSNDNDNDLDPNIIEEISSLVNLLTTNNADSHLDPSSISKLKSYTTLYKPGKGIMSEIVKRPLREPLVCFRSLLLIHILLAEGYPAFKSDSYDSKDLFNNLHLGWLKQKDKYTIVGDFLSQYSSLIHKLVLFHFKNYMVDGSFGFDEAKLGVPDNVMDPSHPISAPTIQHLFEIMEQIFVIQNTISEIALISTALPLSLIVGCLEVLASSKNFPTNIVDKDFSLQSTTSRFHAMSQQLRDQYIKLSTFNSNNSTTNNNPFDLNNGNNLAPSFNPFAPSPSPLASPQLGFSQASIVPPPGANLQSNNTSPSSSVPQSPVFPQRVAPLTRFPHSASLEDARLYTLILTPTPSPPLSPSFGRLSYSNSNLNTGLENLSINPQQQQQQSLQIPNSQQQQQQSHFASGDSVFSNHSTNSNNLFNNSNSNNLIPVPSNLHSSNSSAYSGSGNPFDHQPSPTSTGHPPIPNYPIQKSGGSLMPPPSISKPPTLSTTTNHPQHRGHRRSQSNTTDVERRKQLLQQQLDQNRDFLYHQRQVNSRNRISPPVDDLSLPSMSSNQQPSKNEEKSLLS
eukprot:gene8492-10437_t